MKKFLSITIVAAILLTAIAIPVLAEDEIPMWVNSVRLTYRGRNTASARIIGTVAVRDANRDPVAGANVVIEFTDPRGFVTLTSAETSDQGAASFRFKVSESGTYTLCVFTVTKEGWEYHPELNTQNCDTLTVP
jgi:hypothetical protein